MHRALGDQPAAQRSSVENLGVGTALALHPFSMKNCAPNRGNRQADY
jgi:hypothetical protein